MSVEDCGGSCSSQLGKVVRSPRRDPGNYCQEACFMSYDAFCGVQYLISIVT